MTNTNTNTIDKITALLNTANHPNTPPHEAATAAALAEKLMLKYAIDASMVGHTSGQPDEIVRRDTTISGKYGANQGLLYNSIASAFGAKPIRIKAGSSPTFAAFGTKATLDAIDQLFGSLRLAMVADAAKEQPYGVSGAQLVGYRASFMKGWLSKVGKRLKEQQEMAKAEATTEHGPGVGIMLRDQDARVRDAFRKEFGGKVRTTRTRATYAGHAAGSSAGERADIGNRRIGGRMALGAGR